MRILHVRLNCENDVIALSSILGCNVKNASRIEMLKDQPNLFGWKYMFDILRRQQPRVEKEIDISEFEWEGMPEYYSKSIHAYEYFEFHTNLSCDELSELFEQPITDKTKSLWYPKLEKKEWTGKVWYSEFDLQPQYPIYIISKGRPHTCKTAQSLEWMGLDYYIVVEPQEFKTYQAIWGHRVIQGDFDTTTRSSIPVRNWVDNHCTHDKYWLMDDNINYFYILNNNERWRAKTGAIFLAVEDFVARHSNIALAGLNKLGFCKPFTRTSPYVLNTRVYSCTLMDKTLNEEIKIDGQLWRGRYNEDTDLNIRFLKQGYCTVNFQWCMGDKATTQRLKGGNTDSVYVDGDNRLAFAQSLVDQHPDIVRVSEKWGRFHHHVDWEVFQQQLIKSKCKFVRDYGLFLGDYNDGITIPIPNRDLWGHVIPPLIPQN